MTRTKDSSLRLPEHMSLTGREVHVWKIRIDDPPIDPQELYENILSADERERADRLRFKDERRKYIISRGTLRSILSKYLESVPGDIVFEYNKHGKPSLPPQVNPGKIRFNLSHCRNLVVYAIAKDMEIGIDIEYLREVKWARKIIDRFFSPEERDYYNTRPDHMKTRCFFKLWTGKEAYTKARGRGFSLPLSEHDISLVPGHAPRPYDGRSIDRDYGEFSLYEIKIADNYISSLAVEGRGHKLIYI